MKKLNLILLAGLLSAMLPSTAQEWVNYSNVTTVTDIEPVGTTLWATAKGGVVQRNMTTGTTTFMHKGDAGLPSNDVEQIAVSTTTGVIWVGTYDAGVVEWDGDTWTTYPFPDDLLLYRMKFDSFGNLWLQTDAGIYTFDCTDHTYTFVNSVEGVGWYFDAWDFDLTPDDKVMVFTGTNALVIDAATATVVDSFMNSASPVVLACTPTSVRVFGVDDNTYLIYNGFQIEFEYKDGSYGSAMSGLPAFCSIQSLIRGNDDEIFALVDGQNIYRLDGMEWTLVSAVDNDTYPQYIHYADAETYYFNGSAYMAPPSIIEHKAGVTTTFPVQEFAFSNNWISGVIQLNTGEILIPSNDAFYQYDADADNFAWYADIPLVYNVSYDPKYVNGNIYLINYGNLLQYFDGTEWTVVPAAAGYASIYIFDYDVAPDGTIYFVNDEGLFAYKDGTTEILLPADDFMNWFLSVHYDATRDLLWLGRTTEIVKYDFTTQEIINSADVPEMAAGPAIQEIMSDPSGNVWFGANNNRAYQFDGVEWTAFTVGNAGDFVIDFAFNGTKTYFGLTDGEEGIYVYDAYDASWTQFNTSVDETMFSNSVSQIHVEADGTIWIAHEGQGVSRFDAETGTTDIEVEPASSAALYPNPVAQTLFVSGLQDGTYHYTITDLNGRVVWSSAQSTNGLGVAQLPSGMYMLLAANDTGVVLQGKFIKE